MGESRSQAADNASVSSEDSIKPPPRHDPSKAKAGPGALRADAFDPLKHNEIEHFWHQIEQYFQPINQDHLHFLRNIPVNPENGLYDPELRLPHVSDLDARQQQHLSSSQPPPSSSSSQPPQPSSSSQQQTPSTSTREKKREAKREAKREKFLEDPINSNYTGKRPAPSSSDHHHHHHHHHHYNSNYYSGTGGGGGGGGGGNSSSHRGGNSSNHHYNNHHSHNNSQNSHHHGSHYHHRSGAASSSKVKQESNIVGLRSSSNSYNSDTHNKYSPATGAGSSAPPGPSDSAGGGGSGVGPNGGPSNSGIAMAETPLMRSSLNSYPYTQRLIAALLDENVNGTATPSVPHSSRVFRSSMLEDHLWSGVGTESEIRSYQSALEARVKHELKEKGWLDEEATANDELDTEIRKEQWKLRDIKTVNRMRKRAINSRILNHELRPQAERRTQKLHNDDVERAYLERMISKMKKNKKSRAKFQKLLQRMFGHYKENEKNSGKTASKKEAAAAAAAAAAAVAATTSNGRAITSGGEEKVRSGKKKKNKKSNHDVTTKSASKGLTRKSAP